LYAALSDYVSCIPTHRIAATQTNSNSKNGHLSSSIMANKDEGAETKMERARKTGWSRGSIDSALERLSLNSTSQLVIGIDFGTTYTGVAFAHSSIGIKGARITSGTQSDLDAVLEKIAVVKAWPNANQQFAEKTPSIMAYENGKPVAWGGQLKRAHKTRIACFKLGLQEGARQHYQAEDSAALLGGYINDPNWKHPDLPNKTAIDIAADYLALVGDFVINNVLRSRFGEEFLKNEQISYALTIPAIWSDKAKDATKQVAEKAGIPMDRMILITEPEAAAQYCATTCLEVNLQPGDHFLVCDAGGGTVVNSLLPKIN
jgi:molecular chaperone DnaK (HSP70)